MRTSSKYVSMLTVMFILIVCSCSKEENPGIEVPEGIPTWISVSSSLTKAVDAGRVEESTFKTLDIAVYNSAELLVSHTRITLSGGTTWNGLIQTKTGTNKVFAGVNLTDAQSTAIASSGLAGLKSLIMNIGGIGDIATDNNFLMSNELVEKTIMEWDGTGTPPPSNDFSLDVERFAAKFTAEKATGFILPVTVDGGTINNDLRFAIGQMSKSMYIVKKVVSGSIQSPHHDYVGTFPNPNLTGMPALPDPVTNDEGDFIAVNENGVSSNDMNARYAPENTTANVVTGNLTYLTVVASFYPDNYVTDDTGTTTPNDKSAGETFFCVDNGGMLYFYDEDVAVDYCTLENIPVTEIKTYTNALCYYTVYVNLSEKFSIYRNDFYKSTIHSISGLGDEKPGPVDPTQPPKGTATIAIEINVQPWNVVFENHDLQPQ